MLNYRPQFFMRYVMGMNFAHSSAKFSGSPIFNSGSYYEDLGISKNSTHGEIKAAYYRLSMLYHPDKNQGSKTAAKKFRQITQAYEVLGNYKLRRLYDKGIIHTAGDKYARTAGDVTSDMEPNIEDDPSTKFYKSRFTKSTVTDVKGRTPIYNFDAWSRAHYGDSFQRRKAAKEKYERSINREKDHKLSFQSDILLFSLLFLGVLSYANYLAGPSYDSPKDKTKNKSEVEKVSKRA